MTDRPSHLFKYQAVSARSLENLKARTLYFSTPSAFNDPFDCALELVMKDLDDDDLDRAYAHLRSRADLDPQLEAELTTDGVPNERAREVFARSLTADVLMPRIEETRSQVGVACFSAKNDDLLMWAHYADGHRGFCLEFDTSLMPFSRAEPVPCTATASHRSIR